MQHNNTIIAKVIKKQTFKTNKATQHNKPTKSSHQQTNKRKFNNNKQTKNNNKV